MTQIFKKSILSAILLIQTGLMMAQDVPEKLLGIFSAKAKFLCNSLIMSRYKIENKKRVTNWLLLKFPELP